MKKASIIYICIIVLSAALVPTTAKAQQKLTLQECIDIALQNNRDVRLQQLTSQQREIAYNQARADLLPNLNASAGQSFSFGRSIGLDNTYQNTNSAQTSFGLSSNVTLFDGLRMKHNIDARRAESAASQADLEKMEDDIILAVSTAFLQVLMNKELLQIADEQLKLTESNMQRILELVKNGKAAQGEVYEIEAQVAREELNQIRADNNLKLALLDLAQIMELENFASIDVVTPNVDSLINDAAYISAASVYESALVNRPEIRGAMFRMAGSEKGVKIAKAQYMPSLSLGAQTGTGYYRMGGRDNSSFQSQMKNNMSTSFGFNLSIPIFNRFQIRNSVRNAEIALEQSRLAIDKTKLDLRKRVEQAYFNATAAKSRWQAATKSETASREAYRFAEQKYENGRATSYELFQAKSNLTQVLGEETQSKYEYAFRLKILELLKD